MSRYRGNDEVCTHCGLKYRALNTGLTYQAVYDMLKDGSDDPEDWTYKRRNTVLGKWHQIKKEAWELHLYECEQQAAFETQPDAFDEEAWVEPQEEEVVLDEVWVAGAPF